MRKYPIHVTWHRVKHQIQYASLEEVSKKVFMTNNLQQELHTMKNHNEKCIYNDIMKIHTGICLNCLNWSMECLNVIQKRKLRWAPFSLALHLCSS